MDINYFMEFLVLTEVKNFSIASDMLFLSAPTLSRHIKAMETELGVTLFDRKQRTVELTTAGEEILPYAKQIITARNKINFIVNSIQSKDSQTVNIASTYRLYELIDVFNSENSSVHIRSITNHYGTEYSLDQVRKGNCELAVLTNCDTTDNEFVFIPYAVDHYAAVLTSDHPLSRFQSLKLSALRKEKFITFPSEYDCANDILALCRSAGFEPDVICTASLGGDILTLLPYGGISLLMQNSIRHHIRKKQLENICVIPLEDVPPVQISMCFLKDRPLSEPAQAVVDYVMSRKFGE